MMLYQFREATWNQTLQDRSTSCAISLTTLYADIGTMSGMNLLHYSVSSRDATGCKGAC